MKIKLFPIVRDDSIKYFTELSICEIISLPIQYIVCQNPIIGNKSINIISSKFIDTFEGRSIEGQYLSGKKFIFIGKINLQLIILSYYRCERIYFKNINLFFSNYIIVPKDICINNSINIGYLVEDITAQKLTKNKIIVSATVLIQYKDEYID